MVEKLKVAIEMLREDLENNRSLEYPEGSIGITSLLYCPLKVEYRGRYPELKRKDIAIDDGFIFENSFAPYLERVFDGKVEKDAEVPYEVEVDGEVFKITGHPDFLIEEDGKVIILEFKNTIFMPVDGELPESDLIYDKEKILRVKDNYIKQVKIQKYIAKKYYGKDVEGYLFIKTTIQDKRRKMRKVLVLQEVEEIANEDEIIEAIREFKNNKRPRYDWECRYCAYVDVCYLKNLERKMKDG